MGGELRVVPLDVEAHPGRAPRHPGDVHRDVAVRGGVVGEHVAVVAGAAPAGGLEDPARLGDAAWRAELVELLLRYLLD